MCEFLRCTLLVFDYVRGIAVVAFEGLQFLALAFNLKHPKSS